MSRQKAYISRDTSLSLGLLVCESISPKSLKQFSLLIAVFFSLLFSSTIHAQRSEPAKIDATVEQMVSAINQIRAVGCRCGRKYKGSAGPVSWNDQLKQSSQDYAIEMYKYKRFGHNGIDGSVVGDRVDDAGYFWQLAGENIAEGYGTFSEVLDAWMDSPSHCELIMDGRMSDVAVSKYGKYWTLHMAKPMPPGTTRSNVRYR